MPSPPTRTIQAPIARSAVARHDARTSVVSRLNTPTSSPRTYRIRPTVPVASHAPPIAFSQCSDAMFDAVDDFNSPLKFRLSMPTPT